MSTLNLRLNYQIMIRSAPRPVDETGALSNRKKYRVKRGLNRQDSRQYF